MFTNISWTDYGIVIAILVSLYYLLVSIRYYPTELKELLSGKRKLHFGASTFKGNHGLEEPISKPVVPVEDDQFVNTSDTAFDEVESLISALKESIENASQRQYVPQEFKYSLKQIFKNYPQIQNSPFQSAIHELILSECEKHGTITLSEDDIVRLWDDVV